MKITSRHPQTGNTLLVTMVMTGLMGISLASYLALARHQNLSIMRSVSWNACIPLSEAGIEEAMTHLNRSGISNLASSGWELTGGVYRRTRYLNDSYYIATISATDPPTISSEGHAPAPVNPGVALGWLAALGVGVDQTQAYTGRKVQVSTRRDSVWTKAMVAKGTIDLNGNNITTDSFDSTDPSYSTGGQYDSNKRRDRGDIATNLAIVNSINVGNADLWGRASTGPGGSVSIGPNGSIGDLAWHTAHNGIEPGWTADDMNVYFPDVSKPFTSGFSPTSGSIGTATYAYLLNGGLNGADYLVSNLSIKSSEVLMVTNRVRLLVTGSLSIKGMIRIAKNSSLELYMEGATADIGGNGVANDAGYAINFLYFGLPTHTSLSFSGNGAFTGAIYAPNADFTLSGGGNNTQDFVGASASKTVKMNGHFNFHYDEALGRIGWSRGYLITAWREM